MPHFWRSHVTAQLFSSWEIQRSCSTLSIALTDSTKAICEQFRPKSGPTKSHRICDDRKSYQQLRNADQKLIETVFLIAICRQWGDKWQSKTLLLLIFYQHSSIVLTISIAPYPV